MVATQVTDTPFGLEFMANLKIYIELPSGDMKILLSLRIIIITTNAMMAQTNNISFGTTH